MKLFIRAVVGSSLDHDTSMLGASGTSPLVALRAARTEI